MRVAIAGGHGKIGMRLARLLHDRGDEVLSLIRKAEQSDDVQSTGAAPVVCDLENTDVGAVAEAVGAADAIVFAAGAGPGSGPERKETMDYGGAVKLIQAAQAKQISRYLMVSAMGADASAKGDGYAVYVRAKGRADDALVSSGLDYTIVRPGRLTDDPGDGLVRIGARVGRGSIPRDDVAEVLAVALYEPATIKKLFEAIDGDQPVAQALTNL